MAKNNIKPVDKPIEWDVNEPAKSLLSLRDRVDAEGQNAIAWYWTSNRSKRIPSQLVQFFALFLTATAGLLPILLQAIKGYWTPPATFDSGLLPPLLLGTAAALLGLDKAFGFSSGWTRYVLSATSMTKLLHEFRLDWVALSAAASTPPSAPQQAAMIQRAKDFISTIQSMIAQETKDWATEFQSNMAQMEKDLKTQLDSLKAQVDKSIQDKEAATKPGAIELTVTNANQTDGFTFDVVLEGQSGKSTEAVSNSTSWTRIGVAPGQYKVTINAKIKTVPLSPSKAVIVAPGGIAAPSVTL